MTLPQWFYELPKNTQDKLSNDVFYFSMVQKGFSYIELLKSGWITTEYSLEEDLINKQVFTTSLPYDLHISPKEELCILLNTGSYAPAHEGHIEMMLRAKKLLEENGFTIDAMLFSPSHDSYVLKKSNDISEWNIVNRIKFLDKKIELYQCSVEEKDLFSIDVWESLYCNCPVNFTDVIMKIKNNIDYFLKKKVKIFYVFGSDNEQFMDCFDSLPESLKDVFFGVCVQRSGFIVNNPKISKNCFYTKNNKFFHCMSRLIRKSEKVNMDTNLSNSKNFIYGIRLDTDLALKNWIKKYPNKEEVLKNSYFEFHNSLKQNISNATELESITIDADIQLKLLEQIDCKKLLNLDSCTNYYDISKKIDFSRLFSLNSLQKKPIKIISTNCQQINISPGEYILVDDDIATGTTMFLVKSILEKKGIKIIEEISLLDLFINKFYNDKQVFDIVDTRDFLFGTNQGGLFCALGINNLRIPYFSPWVNLNSRAKIDFNNIKQFNLNNLIAAKTFFNINSYLNLSDFSPALSFFMRLNYSTENISSWIDNHFNWIANNMS